jgi:hypothetical protein
VIPRKYLIESARAERLARSSAASYAFRLLDVRAVTPSEAPV